MRMTERLARSPSPVPWRDLGDVTLPCGDANPEDCRVSDGDLTRNSVVGSAHAVVQAKNMYGSVHIRQMGEPRSSIPRQLPFDTPDFIGRDDELRQLGEIVAAGRTALVSGPPGAGKTALVVRWAHRESLRFPDGQLYMNLRGFDMTAPVSARQALDGFVRALGVAPDRVPERTDELASLYRTLLADRRVLVVLDNAGDIDQISPLLPGTSACGVLVTSRRLLGELAAGVGARRITLSALSPADAVELLGAAAGSERLAAEPEATGELARLCACLPLALRIAGERVSGSPYWTIADLVEQFTAEQHRLDLLASREGASPVRLAFSWSYRKLPTAASSMFRWLGVHAGPEFGVRAAAAAADMTPRDALQALEVLVDANLLIEVARERYRFHDLVRLYAVERVNAEEDASARQTAVRRLLDCYLETADAADHLLTRRSYCVTLGHTSTNPPQAIFVDQRAAARWCELERANLLASVQQAVEWGEHSIAWRLPVALWGYFFLSKPWQDWTRVLTIGLEAARSIGDRRGEAWTLHSLREAQFSMHRVGKGAEYVERALEIFREIDDQWGVREALSNVGYAHRLRGRPDEALTHLVDALGLWRQTDDRWGQAWTLHSLGETYLDLRRSNEATPALREALNLFQAIGHRQGEGFALGNLGHIHLSEKRFEAATELFHQALVVHDEIGDRWSAARSMIGLGAALHATGSTEAAEGYWRQALTICEDLDDTATAESIRMRLTQ
ncbi:hypothetical protein GCM10010171_22800 [Actinokineospora fastidiosa]|uniref:Uncharacterized protein n=2 Tax=Actinokineospora fastidiosa TaxID=1816 RepID=A0A918GD28_9PSEU|nr:hypothetical protein GCM10010171_22800 [Actinokineospora fastidiosa]